MEKIFEPEIKAELERAKTLYENIRRDLKSLFGIAYEQGAMRICKERADTWSKLKTPDGRLGKSVDALDAAIAEFHAAAVAEGNGENYATDMLSSFCNKVAIDRLEKLEAKGK